MDLTEEIVTMVVDELQVKNQLPLACYQPKFIVEQIVAAAKYEGVPPKFTLELVRAAMGNLYTKATQQRIRGQTAASTGGNGADSPDSPGAAGLQPEA